MTKILLVDDSKFLRMAIERALARAGYEVITAIDGPSALEVAHEQKPDLILLDMLLPKMTGPDVLKALKKDPATEGISVVVFTGLSHKNAVRLQQDGAYAFLEKSELGLDKGCETLLARLAEILRRLNLKVASAAPTLDFDSLPLIPTKASSPVVCAKAEPNRSPTPSDGPTAEYSLGKSQTARSGKA
jgi:Response regulator containing CheY-like receiver, AAA-type ATPase, and DNA-binding domains